MIKEYFFRSFNYVFYDIEKQKCENTDYYWKIYLNRYENINSIETVDKFINEWF